MSAALLLAVGLSRSVAAQSDAALAGYLHSKDSIVRALSDSAKRQLAVPAGAELEARGERMLEMLLRPIVRPFSAPGFRQPGHFYINDLFFGEPMYGRMDGIEYMTADSQASVVVTTKPLVKAWLADGRNGHPSEGRPLELDLRDPDFYNWALNEEAAVSFFTYISVPDSTTLGIVSAMLVRFTQDDAGPITADRILVAVARSDRVFLVKASAAYELLPPQKCVTEQEANWRKKLNGDTVTAIYHRCYREDLLHRPEYQRLVQQIRTLVKRLPPR